MAAKNNNKKSASGSNQIKLLLWGILALVVVAIGVMLFKPAAPAAGQGGIRKVDSAGLTAAKNAGAKIVDVRTDGEFSLGHIPGSVNVPLDQLQQTAQGWDKNADYVLYCASGARSAEGQNLMQQMGFKNVADLSGGVAVWNGALEKGASSSSQGAVQTSGKPVFIDFYTPT